MAIVVTAAALGILCPRSSIACEACGLSTTVYGTCHFAEAGEGAGYRTGGSDDEVAPFRTANNGWTVTASGGSSLGSPATVTWSVVPDGTSLPTGAGEPSSPSNLVSFLDDVHHNGNPPGGNDLAQRAWWGLMDSAFTRWESISGLTFQYEPNDDGRRVPSFPGALGVRGDYRISGHSIDGQISPTIVAYNFFPNTADMVIDTDEENRWSNPANNFLLFRNTMMHEIGHGIGLLHIESEDVLSQVPEPQFGTFLMEPTLTTRFDGPQFDDILGAQRLYGDALEKDGGNDTYFSATDLGDLSASGSLAIGTDANDTFVAFDETDFVSIDDDSDVDFFHFSVNRPTLVDLVLEPMGPTYLEGPQNSAEDGTQRIFNAAAQNNLSLSLFDTDGTSLLGVANANGLGLPEELLRMTLPEAGDYFVRIGGAQNTAQMYQFQVAAVPEPGAVVLLSGMVVVAALTSYRRHR